MFYNSYVSACSGNFEVDSCVNGMRYNYFYFVAEVVVVVIVGKINPG